MKFKKGYISHWPVYWLHMIGWCLFIFLELATFRTNETFGNYAIHYILSILLFYAHAHLVYPGGLNENDEVTGMMFFLLLLELVVFCAVAYVVEYLASVHFELKLNRPLTFNFNYILKAFGRMFQMGGVATAYHYLRSFISKQKETERLKHQILYDLIEKEKMEKELLKTQNALLRAQINPHFLFNILNFIYNKTRNTVPAAATAILSLSGMMRYAIHSSDEDGNIQIANEIEQVKNLVYLNQLVKRSEQPVKISCSKEVGKLKLQPLVLLTLAENMCKHGNFSQRRHKAFIRLYKDETRLIIETKNLIASLPQTGGLGSGLQNIQKRLNQAYGDAVHFVSGPDKTGKFYQTILTIELVALHTASIR